jgi:hypothetical protein
MENQNSSDKKEVEHDYFKERLEEQIVWHGKKSRENKKRFLYLQTAIIITSATIAIINTLGIIDIISDYIAVLSSVFGGTIVIITAIMQLHKFQENWITYRTTAELLKKEKYYYLNDVGDYSGLHSQEKKRLLVERVENIVSAETSKYFLIHKSEKVESKIVSDA